MFFKIYNIEIFALKISLGLLITLIKSLLLNCILIYITHQLMIINELLQTS